MPSCLQFTLSISTTIPLSSVLQLCVWPMNPCVEFIVQSPFALSPLQRLHCYYGLIRESYSPVELRLFNLYQQPFLNRTFPTLIFDLFWDALTRYIRRSTRFLLSVCIKSDVPAFPTWGIKVGLLKTLANDFTQAVQFRFAVFALC